MIVNIVVLSILDRVYSDDYLGNCVWSACNDTRILNMSSLIGQEVEDWYIGMNSNWDLIENVLINLNAMVNIIWVFVKV